MLGKTNLNANRFPDDREPSQAAKPVKEEPKMVDDYSKMKEGNTFIAKGRDIPCGSASATASPRITPFGTGTPSAPKNDFAATSSSITGLPSDLSGLARTRPGDGTASNASRCAP